MRVTGVSSLTLISWFKFLGSLDKLKSITHLVCLVLTCWVFWLQHEPCIVTERKEVYYIFCFVYLDSWLAFADIVRELFVPSERFVKTILMQFSCIKGCVPLGWSRSGSAIQDHWDHDRSNEPMNPLWTRIQRQNGCYILSRVVVSLDLESSISTSYCQSICYMSNILSFGNHEKDSSFLSEKYTI